MTCKLPNNQVYILHDRHEDHVDTHGGPKL